MYSIKKLRGLLIIILLFSINTSNLRFYSNNPIDEGQIEENIDCSTFVDLISPAEERQALPKKGFIKTNSDNIIIFGSLSITVWIGTRIVRYWDQSTPNIQKNIQENKGEENCIKQNIPTKQNIGEQEEGEISKNLDAVLNDILSLPEDIDSEVRPFVSANYWDLKNVMPAQSYKDEHIYALLFKPDTTLNLAQQIQDLSKQFVSGDQAIAGIAHKLLSDLLEQYHIDYFFLYLMKKTIELPLSVPNISQRKEELKLCLDEFQKVAIFIVDIVSAVFTNNRHGDGAIRTIVSLFQIFNKRVKEKVDKYTLLNFEDIKKADNIQALMKKPGENKVTNLLHTHMMKMLEDLEKKLVFVDAIVPVFPTLQQLFFFLFRNDFDKSTQRLNGKTTNAIIMVKNMIEQILQRNISSDKTMENYKDIKHLRYLHNLQPIFDYLKTQKYNCVEGEFCCMIFASMLLSKEELDKGQFLEKIYNLGLEMANNNGNTNLFNKKLDKKLNVKVLVDNMRLLLYHVIDQQTSKIDL